MRLRARRRAPSLRRACLLAALAALAVGKACEPPARAGDDSDIPPVINLLRCGCNIDAVNQPRGGRVFLVRVWAEHETQSGVNRDWQKLYARREKRRRALKDCEGWLARVERAQREHHVGRRRAAMRATPPPSAGDQNVAAGLSRQALAA